MKSRVVVAYMLVLALLIGPRAGFAQDGPQKKAEKRADVTISVEVPLVTVDANVTTEHGDFVTGLTKENFRILDNGVPQVITNFGTGDAPITGVILLEFSGLGWQNFAYKGRWVAMAFTTKMRKGDWLALASFDMQYRIEADFTQDPAALQQALYQMYFPGFSEANLFDAILNTLDRLKGVQGKKMILVLASGLDTFSKHTLDQTLKQVQQTDVSIFAIGMAKDFQPSDVFRQLSRMDYLQAENQLNAFARMTGGRAWQPQFMGEISGIFEDLMGMLRNRYSLAFIPNAPSRDGKFHKIKIELVANDGKPLVLLNEKGKKIKTLIYAREGYTLTPSVQ